MEVSAMTLCDGCGRMVDTNLVVLCECDEEFCVDCFDAHFRDVHARDWCGTDEEEEEEQ
jgi:hypothetical protein